MGHWLPAGIEALAASCAAACAPPTRGFLDTSLLPQADDVAAGDRARALAWCAALAALPVPGGPIVLPEVYGESVGVLRPLRGEGATAALLERWRIATAGARKLDGAAVAAGVRTLRMLDAALGLSKRPTTKGRQTDRRLVAAACWTACAGGRPAAIVTRDGDIRRLVGAALACADGVAAAALRERPVAVWMFNPATGVFAPVALAAAAAAGAATGAVAAGTQNAEPFDSLSLAQGRRATQNEASEAVRAWLSALVR